MIDNSGNKNVCSNCTTRVTPLWRKSNDGSYLCNACGLYFKIHRVNRPIELKSESFKHRQRLKKETAYYPLQAELKLKNSDDLNKLNNQNFDKNYANVNLDYKMSESDIRWHVMIGKNHSLIKTNKINKSYFDNTGVQVDHQKSIPRNLYLNNHISYLQKDGYKNLTDNVNENLSNIKNEGCISISTNKIDPKKEIIDIYDSRSLEFKTNISNNSRIKKIMREGDRDTIRETPHHLRYNEELVQRGIQNLSTIEDFNLYLKDGIQRKKNERPANTNHLFTRGNEDDINYQSSQYKREESYPINNNYLRYRRTDPEFYNNEYEFEKYERNKQYYKWKEEDYIFNKRVNAKKKSRYPKSLHYDEKQMYFSNNILNYNEDDMAQAEMDAIKIIADFMKR
ncbi:Transcriptional regulator GZF3 [Astathelohania contejeani]|uniref:Transcriptional regulator GZF3 n=1 Tax=Astathelohania contejeani TaxID=164912 RepID=A0ABQ7HYP1_9MICR|nr:Transcriptional regulator GZF3 [Thelohania contejeani]